MKASQLIPTEEQDQEALAEVLDRIGVLWMHSPNEGKRKPQYAAKMARLGLKPGVPDVIIFDSPPNFRQYKGAVIELKRKRGGQLSRNQALWLNDLASKGWAIDISHGIDEAIDRLRIWGYLKSS